MFGNSDIKDFEMQYGLICRELLSMHSPACSIKDVLTFKRELFGDSNGAFWPSVLDCFRMFRSPNVKVM